MMRATGTLFVGNTKPVATMAADGTFAITVLAFDRIAAHKVEAWRITHSGPQAQEFWASAREQLTPGQPIQVQACQVRTFLHGRFGTPEVHAQADHIALAPRAQGSTSAAAPPHAGLNNFSITCTTNLRNKTI